MTQNAFEPIRQLFEEIKSRPLPKGLPSFSEDLDIDLDEYDGYIMGYVSSFLNGVSIDPKEINPGSDIDQKLAETSERLNEIIAYKNKLNEIVRLLLVTIENSDNQ